MIEISRVFGPFLIVEACNLIRALMVEEGWPITEETHCALIDSLLDPETGRAWIARTVPEGTAVGMIQLRATSDAATGPRLECFRFYVRPEFRHSGVGRRLIEAAVTSIPDDVEVPVYISTRGALRRSFRRLGFETVSLVHAAPLSVIRAQIRRTSK